MTHVDPCGSLWIFVEDPGFLHVRLIYRPKRAKILLRAIHSYLSPSSSCASRSSKASASKLRQHGPCRPPTPPPSSQLGSFSNILLPTSSCGRGVAVHDSSNTKDIAAPRTSSQRLTLRTSRPSSADPQPASYDFRPTLAPTYALIARCRKFHSLVRRATFRAHSSIFRAFVSESRRALATRGRVGSAV